MINISILYDLIYGVILHDEIKEQNISERVLGLFCLEELYQAEKNKAPQSGNAKGSKTRKNP